ncbi:MAG TPA: hypothetical protein VN725_02085 [Rhodanobacteraceae bacterium]|nr:hypothetical protein [Rhodanobacteraceae bacterium]
MSKPSAAGAPVVPREDDEDAIAAELARQKLWIAGVESRAARFRILSTLPYPKSPVWNRVVTTLGARRNWLTPLTRKVGIPDISVILRLLARAHRYQLVLIAGGERADLVYAALAGLCPWIKAPHVIVDAHWQKSAGAAGWLQRQLLRLANRVLAQVQVHSPEEIAIYHAEFGIPEEKLCAIPWSTALGGYDLPDSTLGDYVLTGGHSFRDYTAFLRAVGELGVPTRIGIPAGRVDSRLRELVAPFPNVTLHTDWSNDTYYRQMCGCRVYAMPIQQGLTRSTGDRTILHAMHQGKLVVSTDSIAPRIYLRHRTNGFIVREPTVECWKQTLREALALDPESYRRIGARAAYDAKVRFNEAMRLARTLDCVVALLDRNHRVSWALT